MPKSAVEYDAIVLAGGRARRLGRVDKATVEIGGTPLLHRVLWALADARLVIVVGPDRPLPPGVVTTSEQPVGGGPVAGLGAGLDLVKAPLVVVLAGDLPFLDAGSVARLLAGLTADGEQRYDGAQLVDETGRAQPLAAGYRSTALRGAIADLPEVWGAPMREVMSRLRMLDVEAAAEQAWDCDTWDDVARARQRANQHLTETT